MEGHTEASDQIIMLGGIPMEKILEQILDELKGVKSEITELKQGQQNLQIQVQENTQILKALEHKADVNKAEHDNFTHQLARIEGSINIIKSESTKGEEAYDFVQSMKGIFIK